MKLQNVVFTLSKTVEHEGDTEVRHLLADGEDVGTAYVYADGHIEIMAEYNRDQIGEDLRKQLQRSFPKAVIQIYGIDYD